MEAMTKAWNPYEPPGAAAKRSAEATGLGVLLIGFLVLQGIANVAIGAFFLFAPSVAHEKFPNDAVWSLPARGALAFIIVLACVLVLRRRRVGLFAYFGVAAASALMNIARDVSIWKAVLASAVPALIVALLVWRRLSLFS
jgi:hypothetical protein